MNTQTQYIISAGTVGCLPDLWEEGFTDLSAAIEVLVSSLDDETRTEDDLRNITKALHTDGIAATSESGVYYVAVEAVEVEVVDEEEQIA